VCLYWWALRVTNYTFYNIDLFSIQLAKIVYTRRCVRFPLLCSLGVFVAVCVSYCITLACLHTWISVSDKFLVTTSFFKKQYPLIAKVLKCKHITTCAVVCSCEISCETKFAYVKVKVKVKVKESRNRPGLAQMFPGGLGSQISWHSAREGGEVVSLTHRPPLPPGIFLGLIFTRGWVDPRAMVRSEGNMSPPAIDPGTVRLVAQRLNHYATPGPILRM
jgi:hypothetical protein